jgi:hypothetical protein
MSFKGQIAMAKFDGDTERNGVMWLNTFKDNANSVKCTTPEDRLNQLRLLMPRDTMAGDWLTRLQVSLAYTNAADNATRLSHFETEFLKKYVVRDQELQDQFYAVTMRHQEEPRSLLSRLTKISTRMGTEMKEAELLRHYRSVLGTKYGKYFVTSKPTTALEACQTAEEVDTWIGKGDSKTESGKLVNLVKKNEEPEIHTEREEKLEKMVMALTAQMNQMAAQFPVDGNNNFNNNAYNPNNRNYNNYSNYNSYRGGNMNRGGRGRGRGQGSSNGIQCFRCGKHGHFMKDCYTSAERCNPPPRINKNNNNKPIVDDKRKIGENEPTEEGEDSKGLKL